MIVYLLAFTVVLLSKLQERHLSSQMNVVMIFPPDGAQLICFILGGVWHHSIDCHINSGSEWWIQVLSFTKLCTRKTSPLVLCWSKKSSGSLFPCLCCGSLNIHGIQWAYSFKQPSSSVMAIVQPLTVSRVGHNSSVVMHILVQPNICWQAFQQCKATTWHFVMKLYSSCVSFINLCYLLLNSSEVHSCFSLHFEQTFLNTSKFRTFRNEELHHFPFFFKSISVTAVLKSIVSLPFVKRNIYN